MNYNLTRKQQEALEYMKHGHNVFLTGQAGTGKSYLLKIFIEWYHYNNDADKNKIYVTSTTGLSSLLIDGITINRYAGIGIGDKDVEHYFKKISKIPHMRKRWNETKVLVIDEISMMCPELFDLLNILAKKIRKESLPFGGIQLILSGDFLQLPPINSSEFCFESFSWDDCIDRTFYFNEILRQNDNVFQKVLNNIRVGICDEQDKAILNSCLHRDFNNEHGIVPTVLFSKKSMVQEYNTKELERLITNGNESRMYKANYKFGNDSVPESTKDFLKELLNSSTPVEDEIQFVMGNQVMLTINMPEFGLANGSRGIITGFSRTGTTSEKNPIVKFLNGRELEIEKKSWTLDENGASITKKQIPLIHAWAITIHKAQGMTLEYIVTDIGSSIFEYGQIYVVLSRVKSLEGLGLLNIDFSKIKSNPKILNYYNKLK